MPSEVVPKVWLMGTIAISLFVLKVHSFRHTAATAMDSLGIPQQIRRQRLRERPALRPERMTTVPAHSAVRRQITAVHRPKGVGRRRRRNRLTLDCLRRAVISLPGSGCSPVVRSVQSRVLDSDSIMSRVSDSEFMTALRYDDHRRAMGCKLPIGNY